MFSACWVFVNPKSKLESLDHFVRARQHAGRNRETDLFSRLEIKDELNFVGCWTGRLVHPSLAY
jgi:hypothetical protein